MRNITRIGHYLPLIVAMAASSFSMAKEVSSISQHGITWTFDRPYESGQFINGDYWVIGPATITKIDPAFDGEKNGSEIDPVPDSQGLDARAKVTYKANATVKTPITIGANKSLVSSIGLDEKIIKGSNWVGERCRIKNAAVLTVLDKVPPTDAFRPPYISGRKLMYRFSDVHKDKLLKLKPPATKPKVSDYEKYFDGCWLDHLRAFGGWYRSIRPVDLIPDYSRDTADIISKATLLLLVDNGDENTDRLLIGVLQLGIDYYGIALQKNDLWRGGSGQGNGRKWPIIFAGALFNNEDMKNVKGFFGEDDQTMYYDDPSLPVVDPYGHLQRGVKSWTGQEVLFIHFYDHTGDYEHLPPSRWNELRKGVNLDGCGGEAYRRSSTSSVWCGEAMAARLMGLIKNWNHDPFFDYVDRWMTEAYTPEQWEALKHAKGNGGERDYTTDWTGKMLLQLHQQNLAKHHSGFVGQMWDMYRGEIKPLKAKMTGEGK